LLLNLGLFYFLTTVPIARQPNIEPHLQDQTSIALNLFNTILDTANTHAELNHSWEAISRDISSQEHWEARRRQLRNQQYPSCSFSFGLSFMSLDSHVSRRRRGLSPEINHIAEIRRRSFVLSTQQSAPRRTLSDSSSSYFSPSPIIHNMAYSGVSGGTRISSSSQSSTSLMIGNLYRHHIPIQSTTNPTKVIKKYGIFHFEEDATTTSWHVFSPLNLAPVTHPLPEFKEYLPRFLVNNIVTKNEDLVAFSNDCHNIGANDNDTCMLVFVNSLEGKAATNFFELPPKIISTW
jgi:hypothetical protein